MLPRQYYIVSDNNTRLFQSHYNVKKIMTIFWGQRGQVWLPPGLPRSWRSDREARTFSFSGPKLNSLWGSLAFPSTPCCPCPLSWSPSSALYSYQYMTSTSAHVLTTTCGFITNIYENITLHGTVTVSYYICILFCF